MLRHKLFLLMLTLVVCPAFPVNAHEEVDWVPSLYEFSQLPATEMYVIPDASGQGEFEVTVGALDARLLNQIDASNFSIEILPSAPFDNCSGAGAVVDGRAVSHEQFEQQSRRL